MESSKIAYDKVEEFQFANHAYLCFDNKVIVHDPDCHCCTYYTGYVINENGTHNVINIFPRSDIEEPPSLRIKR